MKYIIIETEFKIPAAILFHECIEHKSIAENKKVLGAGFCNSSGAVWGFSQSLNIESKIEDSKHVKFAINFSV